MLWISVLEVKYFQEIKRCSVGFSTHKWVSPNFSLGNCQWNYSRYTLVLVTSETSNLILRNDPELKENTESSCILTASNPLISKCFRQLRLHKGLALYHLFITLYYEHMETYVECNWMLLWAELVWAGIVCYIAHPGFQPRVNRIIGKSMCNLCCVLV